MFHRDSYTTVMNAIKTLASTSDCIIFLFLGMFIKYLIFNIIRDIVLSKIQSRTMSVRLSICLSACLSERLKLKISVNAWLGSTIQGIFLGGGTHQTPQKDIPPPLEFSFFFFFKQNSWGNIDTSSFWGGFKLFSLWGMGKHESLLYRTYPRRLRL